MTTESFLVPFMQVRDKETNICVVKQTLKYRDTMVQLLDNACSGCPKEILRAAEEDGDDKTHLQAEINQLLNHMSWSYNFSRTAQGACRKTKGRSHTASSKPPEGHPLICMESV